MKKFVTLFTDSFRELKAVRTITTMAMLAAVAVILGFFSIEYGQFIRIGFSSIPNGIIDYLFGPVVGGIFHGALDIIKYMMKPTGPFCPQLTLVVILAGILYGCFFYKKKLTIWRVLAAKFVVMLVCNVILTTLCLNVLYGQAFMVLLPARALKNLIMWPIDSVIFFCNHKGLRTDWTLSHVPEACTCKFCKYAGELKNLISYRTKAVRRKKTADGFL